MNLSKSKLRIKSFYDSVEWKPPTLTSTVELFVDLYKLTDEEIGSDKDLVNNIFITLKEFGVNKDSLTKISNKQFTVKQWNRLRNVIKSYYQTITNGPTCVININMLPPDAVAVLMNLIASFKKNKLDSSITVDVMDYFTILEILSEENPNLLTYLQPVKFVLEKHGWTDSGFISSPNKDLILYDLQTLVG